MLNIIFVAYCVICVICFGILGTLIILGCYDEYLDDPKCTGIAEKTLITWSLLWPWGIYKACKHFGFEKKREDI